MPKDKKARAASKKARTTAKAEKKSAKKEKKASRKGASNPHGDDSSDESVDLDAVLAEYARQQERYLKVTETILMEPPTPRSAASFLANPANEHELLLFGGETFTAASGTKGGGGGGGTAKFFNDLFVYNIKHDVWRSVTSPNAPLPRSGHAWTRGGNAGGVYLFGGEFSSPKQGTFYHYGDFWRLDPAAREWERIEARKGAAPPSRSGHRMTFFKNYIVLFGGFQDTSMNTRYLNDLWVFDTNTGVWHEPKLPPASRKPDPRSSFTLLPHDQGAVLYGGYSRVKATTTVGGSKAGTKGGKRGGGGTATKVSVKPQIHTDTWFLKITPPAADAAAGTLPTVRWEARKRPANSPNPPRTGATMCFHKGRGVMFGGVHDVELSEEGIESEFFDKLFVWNVERNRFAQLALRRGRPVQARKAEDKGRRARGKEREEEMLRNMKMLEMKMGAAEGAGMDVDDDDEESSDDDDDAPVEKPVVFEMPHGRFNALLAVQRDVLYIYGGTIDGEREITFDEMWAIDLMRLDGAKEIFRREPEGWGLLGHEDEEDSDEEEDDDDDESMDEDEDDEDEDDEDDNDAEKPDLDMPDAPPPPPRSRSAMEPSPAPAAARDVDQDDEEDDSPAAAQENTTPHPRPFESLRAFFARTSTEWQTLVVAQLRAEAVEAGGGGGDGLSSGGAAAAAAAAAQSVKEIRKKGFERAERKWWECREEVMAEEDRQLDAGVESVVGLGEKGEKGGGAGTRRR